MPQSIHPIRLLGPWQATVLRSDQRDNSQSPPDEMDDSARQDVETIFDGSVPLGATKKLTIPGNWHEWLGENFSGVVRYERNFGLPTNLDDQQTVWLVIESVNQSAYVWLNETPLGEMRMGQPPLRQPVRALLAARNRLQIDIEFNSDGLHRAGNTGGLTGEVRLEIVTPES
jgi:beta-galactosidase/beta-glucuronidase